ncbi:MAG TPA: NADP-dependent malic enzyme [Acidobacteriota bacterium]|nr:NADP-dependent malic enzyme [Acidobacteriota bacterium]
MKIRDEDALLYHAEPVPGKLEVIASKPCMTQRDLSIAYTPGVAVPCLRIEKNPEDAYLYTGKSNLVGVVSNGTAVLGLGNIGALAGKPVMEGKGVLFKRFANVDVFDIELDTEDPDEIIRACQLLEPTFGGINLEDIKAPECFYIEEKLKETMKIPVFHDDQHGTAIISGAGLLNALEITGKDIAKARMVVLGAGAAGIACAKIFEALGITHENIIMVDTKGVIYKGRERGMNPYKEMFATEESCRTLEDAMVGAEVFVGVSGPDLLTNEMLKSMGPKPIIFAMANPDPEVTPERAKEVRPDAIVATGRSDYPNQVNNVLGFPFIFRGALDVRATAINEEMKIAACNALAKLAKEDVPDEVLAAYGGEAFHFGPEYIIPKPFDPRVLLREAPAVAQAAIDTGVAQKPFDNVEDYVRKLEGMLGRSREVMRFAFDKARSLKKKKKIVFPEGEENKILRACQEIVDRKIATPLLLGNEDVIMAKIKELSLHLTRDQLDIISPLTSDKREEYAELFYKLRQRKGVTPHVAARRVMEPHIFGMLCLKNGDADGLVCGLNYSYPEMISRALKIIGIKEGMHRVIGLYMMVFKDKTIFFADTTVNIVPDSYTLAETAMLAAEAAISFNMEPRVAMLSFSNFGDLRDPLSDKVAEAVKLVKEKMPDLAIDGEMMADAALNPEIAMEQFPHSAIKGNANVLIFPNLAAGNIAYKLLNNLAGASAIGPILMGTDKPVNVLNYHSSVTDIVNLTAITTISCIDDNC